MSETGRYTYIDTLPPEQRRLKYGRDVKRILVPCARVEDPEVQVGVLALKNLKPDRFRVRGAMDRQPIVLFDPALNVYHKISYPGKSAFLHFDEGSGDPNMQEIVQRSLNRPPARGDHLHLATVGSLDTAGWQTWWTPLPARGNPLHVRLVAKRTATNGIDPTEADRNALTAVFERIT